MLILFSVHCGKFSSPNGNTFSVFNKLIQLDTKNLSNMDTEDKIK